MAPEAGFVTVEPTYPTAPTPCPVAPAIVDDCYTDALAFGYSLARVASAPVAE